MVASGSGRTSGCSASSAPAAHGASTPSHCLAGHPEVSALVEDAAGTLWIGTTEGLYRHRPGGALVRWTTDDGLPGNRVLDVFIDRRHRVWVGTTRGLARIRSGPGRRAPSSITYTSPGGLGTTWVCAGGRDMGRHALGSHRHRPGALCPVGSRRGLHVPALRHRVRAAIASCQRARAGSQSEPVDWHQARRLETPDRRIHHLRRPATVCRRQRRCR